MIVKKIHVSFNKTERVNIYLKLKSVPENLSKIFLKISYDTFTIMFDLKK